MGILPARKYNGWALLINQWLEYVELAQKRDDLGKNPVWGYETTVADCESFIASTANFVFGRTKARTRPLNQATPLGNYSGFE